jgi:hypothetical protein
MRVNKNLVTLFTVLPAVFSTSIPTPRDLFKLGTQRCYDNDLEECSVDRKHEPSQESIPTEICDNIGEERCLGNEWRLECSIDHRWKAVEECPVPGVCGALLNKTFCSAESLPPTLPSPLSPAGRPLKSVDSRSLTSQGAPDALKHCDTVGEMRCSGKHVEECNTEYSWFSMERCDDAEECRQKEYHADCHPIAISIRPILPSLTVIAEWCRTGESRCLGDVLQDCEKNKWKSTMCPKASKCVKHDHTVQCWVQPPSHSTVPEPCTPGDRKCDSNAYALMLCGKDETYHIEKKCTTPGDCMTDGPGQAHCQTGSMDPPKFKRETNGTHCTHGDYACDTHRRFMFQCDRNGTWRGPYQCNRAGACQPEAPSLQYPEGAINCVGSPKYLYPDNRVCETVKSCEFMLYKYCSAVSTFFLCAIAHY